MKQPQDFISANEAATITGLSTSTLGTFAEAGYLHVEVDSDGLQLYSRSELTGLFGTVSNESVAHDEPPARKKETVTPSVEPLRPAVEAAPQPVIAEQAKPESVPPERDEPPAEEEEEEVVHEVAPIVAKEHVRSVGGLRREITKLKTVVDLQERIISMKDKQIKDLKEQRDWLHTRIERSDEKHHRDQILLLSETQTIRELIKNNQVKSPLRSMLEFFRILPPQSTQPQLAAPASPENSTTSRPLH